MIATYLRLLRYLKAHRPGFAVAVIFMVILAGTTGVYAFLVGPVLEFLMTGGEKGAEAAGKILPLLEAASLEREDALVALPVALFVVAVLKGIAYLGQFYFMGMTGQRVVVDLRKDLFRHLLTLPPAWFDHHHSGDIATRFTNDINKVEMGVTYAVASMIRDGLQVIVLLVVAFTLDWRLSLIAFFILPFILIPVVRFARRLRSVTTDANVIVGGIGELILETLGGIRVVQAFTMEDYESRRFGEANDAYVRVMRKSFLVRGASTPTMEILGVGGLAIALYWATSGIASGTLSPAHLLSFFATVVLLYMPVKNLGKLGQFAVTGAASAERVFEILDAEAEIADAPGAVALERFEEGITFEGVRFAYRTETGSLRQALDGIDLELPKGSITALVGPSGGGKTTLASLVPRFYEVSEGAVRIDGRDLRELTLRSLRQQIAVVSQDTVIFNDTVRNNVAYGHAEVDEALLWKALERAQAREFVESLELGLETSLGERGVALSGGQRQRIAIARALLKDAPILILDEATSSLDTQSEAAVQAALEELMIGRTVLVIAHRLSTIRKAHRIEVLEAGRIVEAGTHEELLASGGLYRTLHDLQFKELAEASAPEAAAGA
ncbi:MAG: ABC transporter transmembrane domain-containing protein [Deltaproteobacteria bacterium]|nr:ABC transporter transmembrane domain-containing protein [Deltaproteobacteria bacterium]